MKKHILIVQGGGRPKGNTAQLVSAFTQGAESAGAGFIGPMGIVWAIIGIRKAARSLSCAHLFPSEVRQGNGISLCVRQCEIRRFRANLQQLVC